MDEDKPPTEDLGSTETARPQARIHPERIGPYRLLQRLGEGGMGIVYLAEQERPIRRKVALKIIKPGMDSRQVLARFEAERQALALMNHPNVAKVFDAGATEQGRPYFAMELVKGEPITKHCDRQRLTTHERLALFMQVCGGVQHAHQKGIIHRDIKPSNILVQVRDGERIPKIIDFGVAKATQQRLTERTLFTELGVLIGTPEYMSPEQAEMTVEDIDTRTDVYSLGVLLYQLLVGALPFDPRELRQAGFDEIRRRIREEEPSKPSQRISTLGDLSSESSRRRRTDVATLRRQLAGDLDWIVMKALEKDRARRYGSPSELAADLGRHLSHEPVLAGPPSAVYRARKFVRRHRIGVAAATLLLGVLVAFTVTTTVQSRRIAREARTSDRVSEFLANMLSEVEPEALGSALVKDLRERIEGVERKRGATDEEVESVLTSFADSMRGVNATDAGLRILDEQVLARAGQTIEQQLAEEPLIAARLEHTIGWAYRELGLYTRAEPHLLRAVEIRRRLLGDDDPATLDSQFRLADLYWSQARYAEAEPLYVETLETRERVLGEEHPDTLSSMNNLAGLYLRQARYAEAEPLYTKALEVRRRDLGDNDPQTLWSMNNLALVYAAEGRFDEAEPLHVQALEARRRVLGEDHPDTLVSMNNLAGLYFDQGRPADAEPLLLATLEIRRRKFGHDHPATLTSLGNVAALYINQGRGADAERLSIEALEAFKRVLGDNHPDTLMSVFNLADLYHRQGRVAEAEPLYIEAIEGLKRTLGQDHRLTLASMYNMAILEVERGNQTKAMDWLRDSIDAGYANKHLGEDSGLEPLHGPEFDALVERAQQNAAAQARRRLAK